MSKDCIAKKYPLEDSSAAQDYVELCNNGNGCRWKNCVDPHVQNLETKHVKCGELIGWSSNSGNAKSNSGGQRYHLHIEFK